MSKTIYAKIAKIMTCSLISLSESAQQQKVIVQLKDAAQDSFWYPLTDQLRFGGKGSTAFMEVDWQRGVGTFFGELKINQNAGFASYRNEVNLDLSDFTKIEIPVIGDGREYKILIKDQLAKESGLNYSYQAKFKSAINEKKIISLNLVDFKAVLRGKESTTIQALDKSKIVELGIQVNDGNSGSYRLTFEEWVAK